MKYNIENNIDFYNELYSSLYDNENTDFSICIENDNKDNNSNDSDLCLISNTPLVYNFVELKCGHKFNYGPLYKDIFNHKKKFNNMEQIKSKLKQNQIRCPYCRNVQDELLPYYENFGYPKEHGINFFDVNKANNNYGDYVNPNNQCQYQIINLDSSGNTHAHQCHHYGYVHYILKTKFKNDTKYCYTHKVAVIKQIRESIKQAKKNEKLEAKNKKIEEKTKLKMVFLQKKIEGNANKIINNDNDDAKFCNVILKSGKNKGTPCFANIFKHCLCKRHYNLSNKDKNIHEDIDENIVIDKDIKI